MPDSRPDDPLSKLEFGGHRIIESPMPSNAGNPELSKLLPLDSATGYFGHMVAGIRRHRDECARNEAARQAQLEADWKTVVQAMRELRQQVEKHPRVRYFTISRDEAEIAVKIDDSSARRFSYLILSRRHPEKDYGKLDRVWLINLGYEEAHYNEPLDAMLELVRRVAALLA